MQQILSYQHPNRYSPINTQTDTLLSTLNLAHPTIKFTLERADQDGFVPFLDLKIRLNHDRWENKLYQKEAKRDIFIHARSATPVTTKYNALRNELRRGDRLSSNVEFKEAAISSLSTRF